MTRKEEIREAAVMETGNRYLLQSSFGSLFEVKCIEVKCIEVTDTAFKIFNIIQKSEQWMKKSDFGPYGSYSVYVDLGLTTSESSPKEKKVGGMATVYPLGNEVVSLTKPEGWIDGVGVQSSTAEEENCNAFTDFTKDEESSPAPLESQEELWDEVFSKIPPHNLDDFERRLELLKSKFILTRRKEGYLES